MAPAFFWWLFFGVALFGVALFGVALFLVWLFSFFVGSPKKSDFLVSYLCTKGVPSKRHHV